MEAGVGIEVGAGVLVFTLIGEGITTLITGMATLIATIIPIIRIDIGGRKCPVSISDSADS